jgi:hypothetical protein
MDEPDKNASDQPLPASTSNQNAEEAEPGHDDDPGSGRPKESEKPSRGESREGSQSTGSPTSAG